MYKVKSGKSFMLLQKVDQRWTKGKQKPIYQELSFFFARYNPFFTLGNSMDNISAISL